MADASQLPDPANENRALRAEIDRAYLSAPSLQPGGPGGTSGGMSDLMDAKIAAAEARTDTKFAQVLARLDRMPTTAILIGSLATGVVTTITVVIAVMAYGAQWFGLGLDSKAAIETAANSAVAAYSAAHPTPPTK